MRKKQVIRWVKRGMGVGLALLLLSLILLQLGPVQQWLSQKTTAWLSQKLNARVKVDSFRFSQLSQLNLTQFLLEDPQRDTILALEHLSLNINPWSLLRGQIDMDTIRLSGLTVNIHKNPNGSWNFDFMTEAFGSAKTPSESSEKPFAWEFSPSNIYIDDVYFAYVDESTASQILLQLQQSATQLEALQLSEQIAHISSWVVKRPVFQYYAPTSSPAADSTDFPLTFPDLGWTLQLDSLRMEEGQVHYEQENEANVPIPEGFHPSQLAFSDIHYDGGPMLWRKDYMEANVHSFSCKEQSGLGIDAFSSQLILSDTLTSLRNFSLRANGSHLDQHLEVKYPSFAALAQLSQARAMEEVQVKASIESSYLSPVLINLLSPGRIPASVEEGISLQGEVIGDLAALQIKQFQARQGAQFLLALRGEILRPLYPSQAEAAVQIQVLRTSYQHLYPYLGTLLPPEMAEWRKVQLGGRLSGGLDRFQVQDLSVQTDAGPTLGAFLQVAQLSDYPKTNLYVRLDSLDTEVQDWQGFLPAEQLQQLEAFGGLRLQGQVEGTPHQFQAEAQLLTDLGRITTQGNFNFAEDYQNASYQARLQLDDLDIGQLTEDSLLQPLSLELLADGQGLRPADWNTGVEGKIIQLGYQGYSYDTLHLEGQLARGKIDSRVSMNDPHLKFQSTARLALDSSMSIPAFHVQLDSVHLQPLGFSSRPLSLQFQAKGDLHNYQVDSLLGNLQITNFQVQDSLSSYQTDQIRISSSWEEQGAKVLSINSDFLDLQVIGNYTPSHLPEQLISWVDQYFAIKEVPIEIDSLPLVEPEYPNQETTIRASLRMGDPTPLSQIFVPRLRQMDTLAVDLAFDRQGSLLDLNAYLPTLVYDAYRIDSLVLQSKADETEMKHSLRTKQLLLGNNTKVTGIAMQALIKEDSLRFHFSSADSTHTPWWVIGGGLKSTGQELRGKIDPDLRLNGNKWDVSPAHDLLLTKGGAWMIEQLSLSKNEERIQLEARINPQDSLGQANLVLEQFEVNVLNPFLDLPADYISGRLQGRLEAKDLLRKSYYEVGLDLRDWRVDTVQMGDVRFEAQQSLERPEIVLSAALNGKNNQAQMMGTYHLQEQIFDIAASIPKLSMQTLDPFLEGLIKQSKGYMDGQFTIKGPTDQPQLAGVLNFNDVQTTIAIANTAYQVKEGQIRIDEKLIELDNIRMTDAKQAQAKLDGRIKHQFFDKMALDLQFESDRFQFLNTTATDNDLFYGQLFLQSSVNINGPIEEPRFFINAKTQEGTHFYVLPLTDEQAISEDDFIVFGQPLLDSLGRDTSTLDNYQVSAMGIDLRLNLETTPEATLEIIVDPLSGDKLVCAGTSNLTVDMDPAGNVAINGSYQISEGKYTFSYEQLLKREFNILPDSRISFSGDPLQATLDITTTYETRIPLKELVLDQVSENAAMLENQRTTVQVQMSITGSLIKPVLSFDIIIPNDAQSTVLTAARTRLRQLRNNETELNTQVFGLLLFNSFISAQSNTPSLSDTGQGILLSSVSNLISSQLNRLASQLLKGFDFNLGLHAYRPGISEGASEITTEVQLGVSKRLFNDRLNVKVGGNVNVGVNSQENQTLTAFTGDFALEYQLTPKKNYVLRVYRRSDYDALNEGNVSRTGAGISFKKSLPNKIKQRKK